MQHGATEPLIQEIWIAARPETVFPFFTNPARMVLWMGTEAILDPRPGGSYRINVTGRDIAVGRYHEVVPNTRVVFTWGWEGEGSPVPPGSTTLEITLTPQGNGTLVRLRHLGLPEPAQEQHRAGWIHYLERLAAIASGGDPGPDPWAQQQPQTM